MHTRKLLLALVATAFTASDALAETRSSLPETPSGFEFWSASETFTRSCKMCSDRQRFFFWFDHAFRGGGVELDASVDESTTRLEAYSFAAYTLELSLASFSEGEFEAPSVQYSATRLDSHHDPEEEGEWVMVGNKDCEVFNSCHPDEQDGRCHEWHDRCGGDESESEWLAAVAKAQQGDVTAILGVAKEFPALVRVDRVRGITTLLSCSGNGAVTRQEAFTTAVSAL